MSRELKDIVLFPGSFTELSRNLDIQGLFRIVGNGNFIRSKNSFSIDEIDDRFRQQLKDEDFDGVIRYSLIPHQMGANTGSYNTLYYAQGIPVRKTEISSAGFP